MSYSRDEGAPVVAIIVTYNRLESLKSTVRAYRTESVDALVIIDNGSTDGTSAWLNAQCLQEPRLHVHSLGRNTGGAGGFEAGLRWADHYLQNRGWVVLHDDDAYPLLGVTAEFKRRLADGLYDGYAAVASAVLTPDGWPADINRPILNFFQYPRYSWRHVRGNVVSLRDLYHAPNYDLLDLEARYRVHAASFVGLYLNLDQLPSLDCYRYPDRDLFIYGDDSIYTATLDRLGFVILLDASLRYIHDTTTGYESGVLLPEWKHYYISRNSLRVYRALSDWAAPLLYLFALTRRLLTIFFIRDVVVRSRSTSAFWLGLIDALRGRRFRPHEDVVGYINRRSSC